jgi:hypothetical protein
VYEDVCHYEDQRFGIHRRVVARKDGSRKILLLTNVGERREIDVRGTLAYGIFLMYSQTMCLDCYDTRIDLIIDLIPRTSSFSMVPYRMAPVELAELKVQLDDLTSEGFIRQRISGRGTDTVGEEEGWEV